MNSSLFQALGIIDCAILRYLGRNFFEVVFSKDDWFYRLLPEASGNKSFELSEQSAFLNDFLLDAEGFWVKHNSGQIHSGIWTETIEQEEFHLEAIAAFAGGERFIVINNVQHEYREQQKTLQVARELLITNDRLQSQHQYMNERLSSVLKQNASLLELNLPIQQAIENASLGVIITDEQLKPLNINRSAWQLFGLEADIAERTPLSIILDMFAQQFPEFEQVIETRRDWSGEFYWHYPPRFHKWFQCEIHPIMTANRHLKHWVFTISDMTRLKYLLQNNEALALHDSLTGLPNRQYFWQMLEQNIAQEKRCYVMYVDVDNFKRINELYGHLTGDAMLISAGKRIKKQLKKGEFLARIGADEFAIIAYPDNTSDEHLNNELALEYVTELATHIREDSTTPHYTERDEQCMLPLRIGIATYPEDASQAESLMKSADLALHATKLFAQDPIQFYSKDLQQASEQRLHLESQLRDAITNEKLTLYLQPIIDLSSGKIVKAEALIRWFREDGSSIAPDVFIPVAEQSGLIHPLGKWIVNEVCKMLADFKRHNVNVKISMNLSARQVSDHQLFDFIKSTVERFAIDPHKLELELTEGVLVDSYAKAQKLLRSLRDMGITVAIDDFGTGYSSLSYLKHLPIDHLKIDRSFISDLDSDEDDKAIVLAILALANQLKLGVIAEGVETEQQRDFLKQHACMSAQGFLYARPMSLQDFYEFIG